METLNDDILIRYLSGNTSAEEARQVTTWLSQSDKNEKTLEQLYFIWQASGRLRVMESVNPDLALQKLKKQVRRKNTSLRLRHHLQRLQRIAAILFIPVFLLSVYLCLHQKAESEQYIEVKTNPGMVSSFRLPDGSKVWMNAGSYLRYPVTFAPEKREIVLEGQGYFEVTHNPRKPFIVKVNPCYSVEVLGTEFNITAYRDEDLIETTLVEGSVKLNLGKSAKKTISRILKPKEKAVYKKKDRLLSISSINPNYETAWKDGKIIFKKHPMEDVLKILSRHYNVHFEVKDPQVMESEITAKFSNEQLPQVLEYLKLASGIKFKIKNPDKIENDTLKTSVIEISK